jgi:hypothetical protein
MAKIKTNTIRRKAREFLGNSHDAVVLKFGDEKDKEKMEEYLTDHDIKYKVFIEKKDCSIDYFIIVSSCL